MAVAVRSVRWSSHAMLLLAHDGREQHEHPSMASSRVRGAPVCPPDELRVRGAPLRRAGCGVGGGQSRAARTPTTTTCMSSAETNPIHDGVGENRRIRSPRRPQQTNTNPTAAAGVPMRAMPCHAMPCTPPRRPLSLSEQTVKMGCARRRRRTPGWNE
jgi:hypothetical protein